MPPPQGRDGVTPLGALWLLETSQGRQAGILAAHNDATAKYSVFANLDSDAGPTALLVTRRRLQRPPASGDVVYVLASALRAAGAADIPGDDDGDAEVACRCEAVSVQSANRSAAAGPTAYPTGFVPDAADTHGPELTAEWADKLRTFKLRTTATVAPLSRRQGGGTSAAAIAAAAAAAASGGAFEVPLSALRRALPRSASSALLRAAGGVGSSRIGVDTLADALLARGVWRNREAARAALLAAEPPRAGGSERRGDDAGGGLGEVPVGKTIGAVDATPAGFSVTRAASAAGEAATGGGAGGGGGGGGGGGASAAEPAAAGGADGRTAPDGEGSAAAAADDGDDSGSDAGHAGAGGADADASGSAASSSTTGLLLSALLRRALLAASKQERARTGGSGESVEAAFRALDSDGDGSLGQAELRDVLRRIGAPEATDGELAALLQVLDDDGDGRVSLAELKQFVDDGAAAEAAADGRRAPLASRARSALLAAAVQAARGTGRALDPLAVFREADANDSGRLSARELATLLAQLGCDPRQHADEAGQWKDLLGKADTDADGGVSYAELVALLADDEALAATRRRWGRVGPLLAGRGVDVPAELRRATGAKPDADLRGVSLTSKQAEQLLVDRLGVPLTGEDVAALLRAAAVTSGAADGACNAAELLALLQPPSSSAGRADKSAGHARARPRKQQPAEPSAEAVSAVSGSAAAAWRGPPPQADPALIPVANPDASDDLVMRHPAFFPQRALPPWEEETPAGSAGRSGRDGGHSGAGGDGRRAAASRWLCLPFDACAGQRQWEAALEELLEAAAAGSNGVPAAHCTWALEAMGLDIPRAEALALSEQSEVAVEALAATARRLARGRSRPHASAAEPNALHACALSRLCRALQRAAAGDWGGRVMLRRQALRAVLREAPLCLDVDEAAALSGPEFAPAVGALPTAFGLSAARPIGESESKAADDEDDEGDGKEDETAGSESAAGADWELICAEGWLASVRVAAAGEFVPGSEAPAAARGLATLAGPACRMPLRAPVAAAASAGGASRAARRHAGAADSGKATSSGGFTSDSGPAILFRAMRAAGLPSPTGLPLTSLAAGAVAWAARRRTSAPLAADPGGTVASAARLGPQQAGEQLCRGVGGGLDGQRARSAGVGADGFGVVSRFSDVLPQPAPAASAAPLVTARPYLTLKGHYFGRPVQPPAPVRGIGAAGDPWSAPSAGATASAVHREAGGLLQCLVDVVAARGVPTPSDVDGRSRVVGRAARLSIVDMASAVSDQSRVRARVLVAGPTLPASWGPEAEDEWHFDPARVHANRRRAAAAAAAGGGAVGAELLTEGAAAAAAAAAALPGPGYGGSRRLGPVLPVAWASAHDRALTDDGPTRAEAARVAAAAAGAVPGQSRGEAAAAAAAAARSAATRPAQGWNRVAVRSAHPRQPLVSRADAAAASNPYLLIELVAAVECSQLPPAAEASSSAEAGGAPSAEGPAGRGGGGRAAAGSRGGAASGAAALVVDGLGAEVAHAQGTSAVEVCLGWAAIPLAELAAGKGSATRRVRLSGGSVNCPLRIDTVDSQQRRSSLVGKTGNFIVGHRPPTVEVRVSSAASLRAKEALALALLPCGGDGGPAGVLVPWTSLRAMAAARAGAAAVVLSRADLGDAATGSNARKAVRRTASRVPGGPAGRAASADSPPGTPAMAGRATSEPGTPAAGATPVATPAVVGAGLVEDEHGPVLGDPHDPALDLEDDLPGSSGGAPLQHMGAAAAARACSGGAGAGAAGQLRDVWTAVLAANRRTTPNSVVAAVTAAALHAEAVECAVWPDPGLAARPLADSAIKSIHDRHGNKAAAVLASEFAGAAAAALNPPDADSGTAYVPFDVTDHVIGSGLSAL